MDWIGKVISGGDEISLLLIGDHCPYCEEVLDRLEDLIGDGDFIVVNVDNDLAEVMNNIDDPSTPTIVVFEGGKEKGRTIGARRILQQLESASKRAHDAHSRSKGVPE